MVCNSARRIEKKTGQHQFDVAPFKVFLNGFEPLSSEPESDMLPLHHRKILAMAGYTANIKKYLQLKKFILNLNVL